MEITERQTDNARVLVAGLHHRRHAECTLMDCFVLPVPVRPHRKLHDRQTAVSVILRATYSSLSW